MISVDPAATDTMTTVDIDLGARSYAVRIGRDLLADPAELAPWLGGRQVCVVTDEVVAPLYLDALRAALADKQVAVRVLPAGEPGKTLSAADAVFDTLLTARAERDVTVIALGGGVVGDIAGFAAACYQRGVAFIQVPTTLLAQVDSSVGGKTGVNHARGKNMIGAFHQPRRVLADTATLDTLDARQFAAGLAEVVKYGVIADRELFVWLERNMASVIARQPAALAHIIARSCRNKARIVAEDEREHGARALLNFGHTFGHAIEAGSGYATWLHGEAVATGMVMAARLAVRIGSMAAADAARIDALLGAAGLPVAPFAGISAATLRGHMQHDKKARHGELRLVLPDAIGNATLSAEYPAAALDSVLNDFTAT